MPDDAQIPVGGLEIANRLGVRRETVAQWKQRGLLPAPRWTVSGEDAWDWALDIEPWARRTGRLGNGQAVVGQPVACEYREVQDPQYAHLFNPQCACGWRAGGYVKRTTARSFWDSHNHASSKDATGLALRIGGQALSVTHPARVRTTGAEAEAVRVVIGILPEGGE